MTGPASLATSTADDDVLGEASRLVDRAANLLAVNTHEAGHTRIVDGLLTGEILGLAQAGSGRVTVRIEISYRSPAPLHRPLRYSAHLDRIEGRKAFVEGALHDGDRLCAEAQALFVAPRTPPTPAGSAEEHR